MQNLYLPNKCFGAVIRHLGISHHPFCLPVLIVVITIFAYLCSVENRFVYDDKFTITNNYLISSWSKIPALLTNEYFNVSGELSYRPVVTFSYFIDYALWHENPIGYHSTNIFFHCINAVLLYYLLSHFFKDSKEGRGTAALWKLKQFDNITVEKKSLFAFLATLLFCLHPLLTEAVNAISYREDLIMTTGYFAAFYFYRMACQGRIPILWYALSLFCYSIGLFSKEMAVTLPLVIVLYDIVIRGNLTLRYKQIFYYTGYVLVTVFYILVRFIFLHNPAESAISYPQNSIIMNFLLMTKVVASYIKLHFFPLNLSADYVVPFSHSVFDASFTVSFLLIISVIIITYRLYYYSRILFFSVLWFFVTLLPVLNLVPIENIMAERYLYVPIVGFCITGSLLLCHIPKIKTQSVMLKKMCSVAPVVIILSGYSWQTCQRSKVWKNDATLWSETIVRSPQSSRAHNNLGIKYKQMGYIEEAIREYKTAIRIRPEYSEAYGNLANIYMNKGLGKYDKKVHLEKTNNITEAQSKEACLKDAIRAYKKAIKIDPLNEIAHFNLGVTYGKLGLFDNAEAEYKNSIRINGHNPHPHNNLGNIYEDRGLFQKAMAEYKRAQSIDPNNAIAWNNIGNISFKKRDFDKALMAYKRAVQKNQAGIVFHENLANTYTKKGLTDKAIAEFERIIRLQPENPKYYVKLITLYWNFKKNSDKAVFYLKKLSALQPDQKEEIDKMIRKLKKEASK